jgi:hypothetical protein
VFHGHSNIKIIMVQRRCCCKHLYVNVQLYNKFFSDIIGLCCYFLDKANYSL